MHRLLGGKIDLLRIAGAVIASGTEIIPDNSSVITTPSSGRTATTGRRVLASVCGAHGIQDGLVALQFVLFPLIATSFGLSYAQVGLLKAINNVAMSALEIPSGLLAERFGERLLLGIGLIGASAGYLGIAHGTTFGSIAFFFLIAGAGAAFQHSLSSALVARTFTGGPRRKALGIYNACGDAGKLSYTGIFSLMVGAGFAWHFSVTLLAATGLVLALAIWFAIPRTTTPQPVSSDQQSAERASGGSRWGILEPRKFWTLTTVIFLDSVVQAVFLTFIAFVAIDKGLSTGVATSAVVLTLAGGMVGKFLCGTLSANLGDRAAFMLIQSATVVGIVAVIYLPALSLLLALPLIGLCVQGSSTVCYGAVADYVHDLRQSRGYSLIYTSANLAAVVGPLGLGLVADNYSLELVMWILAGICALTIALSPCLGRDKPIPEGTP